jgi:hypothetical protein
MEQEKLSNNKEIYHDTYPFDCHGNEMVYIFIYYIFFALQCTLHSLFTSKYSDPLNLAFSHQTVVVFSFRFKTDLLLHVTHKSLFIWKKRKEKKMIIFESYIFTARPVAWYTYFFCITMYIALSIHIKVFRSIEFSFLTPNCCCFFFLPFDIWNESFAWAK